jgi:hypothetical protein
MKLSHSRLSLLSQHLAKVRLTTLTTLQRLYNQNVIMRRFSTAKASSTKTQGELLMNKFNGG